MSTAPSVGIATLPTADENTARMSSIHRPAQIAAQRERAPAVTLRAVSPTEPPTGWPPKRPDARLPAPWAMKSRLASAAAPPSLGADSATPAPCTITMAATASAPVTRLKEKTPKVGREGTGMPCGIEPMSSTVATLSRPKAMTAAVGMISAMRAPTTASRVRLSRARMAMAARPTNRDASSIRLGCVMTWMAFRRLTLPTLGAPVRTGIWPQMMLMEMPVRKPSITECDTKRV